MLKITRVSIGVVRILKARFLNDEKNTIEKEKKELNKKKEDCLLNNKTSKLAIIKKRKNKCLKSLIKSNLAKKLITITIFSPNKKLQ